MTRQGAVLLLVGAVLIAVSSHVSVLLTPALVFTLVAAILVVVDSRRAAGGRQLTVTRSLDPILSVGAANEVLLTVESRVGRVPLQLRDEWPDRVLTDRRVLPLTAPGTVRYTVTPQVRGEAHFGQVVVRASGPWRLGFRQSRLCDPATVKVDADLAAVGRYDALARRGHLADIGVRTVRRRSEGTEFDRVREAVPDDPLRSINWRATARAGRLMATDYMPERSQPVVIVLDHGRLMGVGAGAIAKLDSAINATALLAHVALHSGDRVGLFAFADRVTATLAPAAGRTQLRRILDAVRPCVPEELESDYDTCLLALSRWQRRRALVIIFTDILDRDQGAALVRQCLRLRRRHLPLVITVRDPALDDTAMEEPVDADSTFRRAIASGLLADREAALQLLRAAGVDTLDADVRTLSPRLVSRYLDIKRAALL